MADKLCSVHVENKKGKTRAIGRTVLGPHKKGLVHFYDLDHVKNALALEEEQEIAILDDIPSYIREQVEEKKKNEKDLPASPLEQVRENFKNTPGAGKEGDGWNSPDDAYAGQDLKDRHGGFAEVTGEKGEKADEDKKDVGEEVTEPPVGKVEEGWNSPDDAYAGEDLKDRDHGEDSKAGEEAEKEEEKEAEGPQDAPAEDTTPADETEDVTPLEEALANAANDGKESWYLNYDEVEDKTKAQLIEWAEKVPESEGLKVSKNSAAKDIKSEVHSFLASKYPEHNQ